MHSHTFTLGSCQAQPECWASGVYAQIYYLSLGMVPRLSFFDFVQWPPDKNEKAFSAWITSFNQTSVTVDMTARTVKFPVNNVYLESFCLEFLIYGDFIMYTENSFL